MTNKPQTDKQKAHMFFKRFKAGMTITPGEMLLVKKYYPGMR